MAVFPAYAGVCRWLPIAVSSTSHALVYPPFSNHTLVSLSTTVHDSMSSSAFLSLSHLPPHMTCFSSPSPVTNIFP